MRNRSIAGSVCTVRAGSRQSRMQPAQRLGQPEPALRPAQQHKPAVGRDRPAREIGGHLLAAYGWQSERERGIFGHGGRGAFVASAEVRWETNFYPNSTT